MVMIPAEEAESIDDARGVVASGHSRGAVLAEWRREWRIGLTALIGTATCTSVWPSVTSLFVQPLQAEFGWSRGQIAFAYNASLFVALMAPLFGQLIDRIGVRRVVLSAMVMTALGFVGLALMPNSLPIYYTLYFYTITVGVCTTGLSFTRLVSGAFVHSRGLALAISRSAVGLSSAVLPIIMFALIAAEGWRAGFLLMAGLILGIAFPTFWLGTRVRSGIAVGAPIRARKSFRVHLTNRKVLLLCAAGAFSYAPVAALLHQFQPLLTGKGVAPAQAAMLVGAIGAASMVGTLASGALVDRIWAPIVACLLTIGPAIGCLLLLPDQLSVSSAFVAAMLMGLAQGAEIDIVAFMVGRYFGLQAYSTIYGITILSISILAAILSNIVAIIFDYTGDYWYAIIICSGCFIISAASYLAMGSYPVQENAGDRDRL